MKLSRKQLKNMISKAFLNESSYEDAKRRRRREYEMQDPGYYPDSNNRSGVTLPEPDLQGSTIEYPGGKKAFLQSMIDQYRRVGMHEEADRAQAKLDAMTDDVFKAALEEGLGDRGDLPKRPPQPSFRYDGPEDFPEGNFLGAQDRDIDSGMIDAAINLLIPLSYDYKNAGIALKALRALRGELRQGI